MVEQTEVRTSGKTGISGRGRTQAKVQVHVKLKYIRQQQYTKSKYIKPQGQNYLHLRLQCLAVGFFFTLKILMLVHQNPV